jgi:hypothetical protein
MAYAMHSLYYMYLKTKVRWMDATMRCCREPVSNNLLLLGAPGHLPQESPRSGRAGAPQGLHDPTPGGPHCSSGPLPRVTLERLRPCRDCDRRQVAKAKDPPKRPFQVDSGAANRIVSFALSSNAEMAAARPASDADQEQDQGQGQGQGAGQASGTKRAGQGEGEGAERHGKAAAGRGKRAKRG